jgi:uncharacterized OB-fold protein
VTTRPLPHPDRDSQPWWEALARHELRFQRCTACGAWRWPPRAICNRCGSFDAAWEPVSGRGTIAGWIVNHHTFSADFPSPYAVMLVRLEEQDDCKLVGSFRGDVDALRTGLPVRAVFDDVADGVTLLAWEQAAWEQTDGEQRRA